MGEGLIRAHVAAKGLKLWDTIRDNDPRMYSGKRVLIIDGFEVKKNAVVAVCNDGRRKHRVRLDRIHTDGKTRRSGFSLVKAEKDGPEQTRPSTERGDSEP